MYAKRASQFIIQGQEDDAVPELHAAVCECITRMMELHPMGMLEVEYDNERRWAKVTLCRTHVRFLGEE